MALLPPCRYPQREMGYAPFTCRVLLTNQGTREADEMRQRGRVFLALQDFLKDCGIKTYLGNPIHAAWPDFLRTEKSQIPRTIFQVTLNWCLVVGS